MESYPVGLLISVWSKRIRWSNTKLVKIKWIVRGVGSAGTIL